MISVIIPFYNEKENIKILIPSLIEELKKLKKEYEIILVDDGSTDAGASELKTQNLKLKTIRHKKRLGKGAALKTGIENAIGDIIVFMDADLQDDPKDIKKFIDLIESGYDFVNGKRIKRSDSFLIKLYSKPANFLLKHLLHSPYDDINCGFKAMKKEVLINFNFYGNNFRFLPLAVYYQGYKVTEVEVNNRSRKHGQSKFGPTKVFAGFFDILTALFLFKFAEKPLHFFGLIGGCLFLIGAIILLILGIERIFFGILLYRRPILFLGFLLVIVGVQIIMTGILGELMVYLNKKKS
jgi:glycosyltransferase involved in cell wall biosynthesis